MEVNFTSEFVGATVDELGDFVKQNFGAYKKGQGTNFGHDHLACEMFGVIDERSNTDDTILFAVEHLIDPIDEAQIRVQWQRDPTQLDEALARYAYFQATNEDRKLLLQHIGEPADTDVDDMISEEGNEKLKKWYCEVADKTRDTWIELRLKTDRIWWSVRGIMRRGGLDYMLHPGNNFEEDGVMKSLFPWEVTEYDEEAREENRHRIGVAKEELKPDPNWRNAEWNAVGYEKIHGNRSQEEREEEKRDIQLKKLGITSHDSEGQASEQPHAAATVSPSSPTTTTT